MEPSLGKRPEVLLVVTFAALIGLGTVLLSLPVSQGAEPVGLLDVFFTATSAVCVTGLITVDTATAWSRFGQGVILVLIQLGGLGIMTFGALALQVLHVRFSFAGQAAVREALFESSVRWTLRRALWQIIALTFGFEVVGAVLLRMGLGEAGVVGGWFDAVFLSVSAFCNAGFSVYSDSVKPLSASLVGMGALVVLIVAGGLGFPVWLELSERCWRFVVRRGQRTVGLSLHARMVVGMSGLLVVGGAVALFVAGFVDVEGVWGRVGHAVFQSVTARTAGFNTVGMELLPVPALLILILLMFIGGSAGSCAGGVKTTTVAVWLARVWARLRGREDVVLGGRRLPHDLVRRAALVLALGVLWNVAGIMLLSISEAGRAGVRFEHLIFEQVSAFATVGLSAGVTPTLSVVGKWWIIVSMFVGRLGPLTVALAVLRPPRTLYRYPAERVMIG